MSVIFNISKFRNKFALKVYKIKISYPKLSIYFKDNPTTSIIHLGSLIKIFQVLILSNLISLFTKVTSHSCQAENTIDDFINFTLQE